MKVTYLQSTLGEGINLLWRINFDCRASFLASTWQRHGQLWVTIEGAVSLTDVNHCVLILYSTRRSLGVS